MITLSILGAALWFAGLTGDSEPHILAGFIILVGSFVLECVL